MGGVHRTAMVKLRAVLSLCARAGAAGTVRRARDLAEKMGLVGGDRDPTAPEAPDGAMHTKDLCRVVHERGIVVHEEGMTA